MGKREIYVCDVCGCEKRETNRWWIVVCAGGQGEMFASLEMDCDVLEDLQKDSRVKELALACGEEHAHELFSRWLVAHSFQPAWQISIRGFREGGVQ